MESTTIRVSARTHRALRDLAAQNGKSLQDTVDDLLREKQRQRFFEEFDADYRALKSDPGAWKEELEERALWDLTLADGLDRAEYALEEELFGASANG